MLNREQIRLFVSDSDMKRISSYSRNMADFSFIVDLIPQLAHLYFNRHLTEEVELNTLQQATLISIGLQRKSIDVLAKDLNIEHSQLMALFNKVMRKFSDYLDNLCKDSIEITTRDVSNLKPTERSLADELKHAENEIRLRQAKDKLNLQESLGLDSKMSGVLKQFAIKASEQEFEKAAQKIHLAHAKGGILSVKADTSQGPPKSLLDLEIEKHEQGKKRALDKKNKGGPKKGGAKKFKRN